MFPDRLNLRVRVIIIVTIIKGWMEQSRYASSVDFIFTRIQHYDCRRFPRSYSFEACNLCTKREAKS